jgi:uncharacterized membrane protein YiaA
MLYRSSCESQPSGVRVRTYSRRRHISGVSCYLPGLVEAHSQLSESTHIVAVILSAASHAIAQVWSEPIFSCQSPHV